MSDLAARQARLVGDRYAPVAIPGLVAAYRFREGYPAEALEPHELPAAMAAEDGWLWLHFALTDKLARDFIDRLEALPPQARQHLTAREDRLGLETVENALIGVI